MAGCSARCQAISREFPHDYTGGVDCSLGKLQPEDGFLRSARRRMEILEYTTEIPVHLNSHPRPFSSFGRIHRETLSTPQHSE
jgi:hypothetical protein